MTVASVALDYSYSRGYAGAKCSNFSVLVAGTPVYQSPELSLYPYSKAKPDYSPPVNVHQMGLDIAVPSSKASWIEFVFDNNDCNLQLLTPLVVNLTCTGGPCASLPLLPQFFDSNMVLQRETPALIYGYTGTPHSTVTVHLASKSAAAPSSRTGLVAANGSWVVALAPQNASTGVLNTHSQYITLQVCSIRTASI